MVVLSLATLVAAASSQVLSSVSDRVLIQSREEEYLMLYVGMFPRDVRDLPLHAGDDFRDFFFYENVILRKDIVESTEKNFYATRVKMSYKILLLVF